MEDSDSELPRTSGDKGGESPKLPLPPAKTPTSPKGTNKREHCRPDQTPLWKMVLETAAVFVGIYVAIIYKGQLDVMQGQLGEIIKQYPELQKSASAAKSAADTAHDTLVLAERPWVKIKHRIIKPLTFNVPGTGGPIDSMTVEDTLENVGTSVALNVFSWEDVIPIDADFSLRAARARQDQWCDANRHRDPSGLTGYMLFPKEPFVQNPTVGGYMTEVNKIRATNRIVPGKVGFVLVGCVCYRSSFEPTSAPSHETKFIYYLAIPQKAGVMPFVTPSGVAKSLQLVAFPEGFSAD